MELVPLVYVKNRKIHAEKYGNHMLLDEVLEQIDKDGKIYVLDIDGIEKDKPNLCMYPKISEHCETWVDAGPRDLGDIVDTVMAGVSNITVRKKLWAELEISGIKDIIERGVYIEIDLRNQDTYNNVFSLFQDADGLVVFRDKDQVERDFKSDGLLKTLCNRYKVYAVEPEGEHVSYWKKLGATGILVDLEIARQVSI